MSIEVVVMFVSLFSVVRSLREFLEMCVSHYYACVCRDRAMCFAGFGSCLKVIESGGSSL